jgi:TDG/mug DNA glycosylase family protein
MYSGLPDHLGQKLSILFVGINPGLRSSELGHHFAGPSNRFWKLLYEAELVPYRMTYQEDAQLLNYGYGLTNLIAKPTAGIQDLEKQDFLQGRHLLLKKIKKYQPGIVAILGMSVARILFAQESANISGQRVARKPIQTGLQSLSFAGVPIFVLPNPSGRNAHYSYQLMKDLFVELKEVSLKLKKSGIA